MDGWTTVGIDPRNRINANHWLASENTTGKYAISAQSIEFEIEEDALMYQLKYAGK